MSYAYTPGLKVKESTMVRKTRLLPISGEVTVNVESAVSYKTVIAETYLPGEVHMRNAANVLDVGATYLDLVLLKKEGDQIKKGDLIGLNKQFFGLIKKEFRSNIDGTVEMISDVTGNVAIRGNPVLITRNAYISGKVVKIIPKFGVVIETPAALIQGIFGIGGETHGEIFIITSRDQKITPEMINYECKDKILIGGSLITEQSLRKAIEVGAKGVIGGGIKRGDINKILGYELGVAITGNEKIPLTVIVTEGFGTIAMAKHTYELLSSLEGKFASINGTTQIRAGVIRPEIIIPLDKELKNSTDEEEAKSKEGMVPGTQVRIIRDPCFGRIAIIQSLPIEPMVIETESKVRIAIVKLEDGTILTVPRANLELMER